MTFQIQNINVVYLHVDQCESKENIIPFTEATLQRCTEKKELRERARKKKSKYDVIVLPGKVDGVSGYHASCYRYFCSISEKAKKADDLKGNAYNAIITMEVLCVNIDFWFKLLNFACRKQFRCLGDCWIEWICVGVIMKMQINVLLVRPFIYSINAVGYNVFTDVAENQIEWEDVNCDSTCKECIFCDRVFRKRNGHRVFTLPTTSETLIKRIKDILIVEHEHEHTIMWWTISFAMKVHARWKVFLICAHY